MTHQTNTKLSDTIAQASDLLCAEVDAETVLMSIESGRYYGFNPILGKIWHKIEQPIVISTLIEQLMNEYQVSQAVCEADVLRIIDEMYAEHLITIS